MKEAKVQYYPSSKQPYCVTFGDSLSEKVCDIRGWGHLTGGGALNLPPEEAVKIQTQWAETICAGLNSANKLNDMGYDGAKCVEMLPQLINDLSLVCKTTADNETSDYIGNILDQLRKGEGDD